MTRRCLAPDAIQFRETLIAGLGAETFVYINEDCFLGECPVCGEPISIRFAGFAPRATLDCKGGCRESEIADLLGLRVRP